jgi:hypothetical protein
MKEKKFPSKGVKITRAGCMNGTWQIKLTGIKDENLYDIEVAILKLFGRKKKKLAL